MTEGNLPRNNRRNPISPCGDVAPDDWFELLSRQLGDTADFPDDESPANDVLWLLEENARLRALAVKLSALVGDLSEREWKDALASADLATLNLLGARRR